MSLPTSEAPGVRRIPRVAALVAATALAVCLTPRPARAQWHVESGVEAFRWREHTTPIEVKESGPRFALGGGYATPSERGPMLAGFARFYAGAVSYDGSLLSSPSTPAHGSTGYLGATEGVGLRYRWPELLDAVAGFEFDQWQRELGAAQQEVYRIVSLRLGVEHVASKRSPWIAGGGVRRMLSAEEEATLVDANGSYGVTLEPGLGSNPYLHAGGRIGSSVTLLAYWDGMRLGRSADVPINRPRGTVFQPESDMDVYGIRLVYRAGAGGTP